MQMKSSKDIKVRYDKPAPTVSTASTKEDKTKQGKSIGELYESQTFKKVTYKRKKDG